MAIDGAIEIVRPGAFPRRIRAVVFDWDGTLSLLREGWPAIMTAQMLEQLPDPAVVERIVVGLNGRPTIVQMQAFVQEVAHRGRRPAEPAVYLAEYQERLFALIRGRYSDIESGRVSAEYWAPPGTRAFLRHLRSRGLPVILLSGTERSQVRRETELLGIAPLIDDLHAPDGDDPEFHKRLVIQSVLQARGVDGREILSFGDGVVETEEVKRAGGVAVAVASETPPRRGVNGAKRQRLIEAGADAVIADFADYERWLPRVISPE